MFCNRMIAAISGGSAARRRVVFGLLAVVAATLGPRPACTLHAASQPGADPTPASERAPSTTPAAKEARGGKGRGVIVKITHRGTEIIEDAFARVKSDPYVTGVQVTISWAELEPRRGEFQWDGIDRVLAQYGAVGKQVAFLFASADGKVPTESQRRKGKVETDEEEDSRNTATPAWLFEAPQVHRVGGLETAGGWVPLYPVFWDRTYQKYLAEFIAAFARQYDGDPRIEFIRMGGWQIGTNEPSFYGGASDVLRDQLAQEGNVFPAGRRPRLSANGPYAQAVKDLVDVWHSHFQKTRLAATIHISHDEPGSFEEAMNAHCAQRGCLLLNTGLNERDHTAARTFFRRMREHYGSQVGWGGITHLGGKSARREGRRPEAGLLLEALKQGLGADGDRQYDPGSKASYVVVGLDALEDTEALKWASEHLVP